MARTKSFGNDRGLQFRMLLTMLLLGVVYVVLIGVLLAAGLGYGGVIAIALVLLVVQLFTSEKLALAAMHAKKVSPEQEPELHALIERLCVQANLPKPTVAVAETNAPNAFAIGRSPKHATVCATRGIMQLLDPAELEGVMAHELTHVQNRDVMVMTVASFFATIAAYLVQFGLFFGGGRSSNDNNNNVPFAVVMLVSIVVYFLSFILIQALSRYREFAADRGAAVITGRPSALASALLKISGSLQRVPTKDLRAAGDLQAFFIMPFKGSSSISNLFSTHPALEKRLAALQRIEAQLQGTA